MRTTAPTPTVYRSLAVTSPAAAVPSTLASNRVQVDKVSSLVETPPKSSAVSASDSLFTTTDSANAIPTPPVPVACLSNGAIWKNEVDIAELQKKLAKYCSRCELRRTPQTCEFDCLAEASDGVEECNFIVNLWSVPEGEEGALGRFLIQIDRCSGCPFFFKDILAKTFNVLRTEEQPQKKLFRPLQLPECMCDSGSGIKRECLENLIKLATSDVFEQRVQGVLALADLCARDKNFAAVFKSVDGPNRIAKLQNDSDCCIKRAVARILSNST